MPSAVSQSTSPGGRRARTGADQVERTALGRDDPVVVVRRRARAVGCRAGRGT